MIKSIATNFNRHIDELKQQLSECSQQKLDYLVIAHSDPIMLQRLKNALSDSSIAVVAIPQSEWDMQAESIDEFMEWAVNELQIKSVLLVGHSLGGTPLQTVQVCHSSNEASKEATPAKQMVSLLERIESAQKFRRSNENHFLYELNLLESSPSISEQTLRNSSLVQGLFYRAESGLFCVYDQEKEEFNALINEDCIS